MATPFNGTGELDLARAQQLASHLEAHGNDALVVSGSTGEAPTLSDHEKLELWRAVKSAVSIPVIAGSTSNDTAHSIELTKAAEHVGLDGIMAVAPYYNRPSQEGMIAHFKAIGEASGLPMIIYDIPVRTGRKIQRASLLRLAQELASFVALKDAAGDPADTAHLLAEAPPGFSCYSGDDHLTLPLLSIGAVGLISVAAHWCGEECKEMIEAFLSGDLARALQIERALLASFDYETGEDAPNPVPTKTMLAVLGLDCGPCRLPMGPAPEYLEDRAKIVLSDLEAWRHDRVVRG